MKKLALLGSTGSIGVNALKVIEAYPEEYEVIALAAGRNISLLLEQIESFKPQAVAVLEASRAQEMKAQLPRAAETKIFFGPEGFMHVAALDAVDTVISAMTGAAGLLPTYSAIKAGKNIALANKETMVMAGALVMAEARRRSVSVLPIDSEHSAILQSLQGHPKENLRRVILTASGGPFRNLSLEEMRGITAARALNHPNWNMGPKVSIDSATLMNKGLEVIEAKWLFDLEMEQIHILIHSQSIVHSMVEYTDGSVICQMGIPDMLIPISYALSYPQHMRNQLPPLELEQVGTLSFEKPDLKRFRCLALALEASRIGGSMPCVLNGANEVAVDSFLHGGIGFLDIPDMIERTMETHQVHAVDDLEAVMRADSWARKTARDLVREKRDQV
ncbi:MAG: 1-deoxy-D-xylulose-5-phosphate reductoisomerase [Desulfatiglandaceae bacterium]